VRPLYGKTVKPYIRHALLAVWRRCRGSEAVRWRQGESNVEARWRQVSGKVEAMPRAILSPDLLRMFPGCLPDVPGTIGRSYGLQKEDQRR